MYVDLSYVSITKENKSIFVQPQFQESWDNINKH